MSILNNKRSIWLLTVIAVLLIGSALFSILRTPPLYQSQIVVRSPCLMASVRLSQPCLDEGIGSTTAHHANYGYIKKAILQQLKLPEDTFYDVSSSLHSKGLIFTVKAESPALAQEIANEVIDQSNLFYDQINLERHDDHIISLTESVTILECKFGIQKGTSQLSNCPASYPPPKKSRESDLESLRKQLNQAKLNKEEWLENSRYMFEILEPATYSEITIPYWKHMLLQYLYPAALSR